MTLLEQWYSNKEDMALLADLLQQPFFQRLTAVLTEEGLPRPANLPPGVDPLALGALNNSKTTGYFLYPKRMRSLITVPQNREQLKEWKD